MAATAENLNQSRRMNLSTLKQRDPFITAIVDTASQVALYSFSSKANEWEKTDIEGTLFVYSRSGAPSNGFMILNRLGLNDLVEPINRNLEFQLQDPFLLYRNDQGGIYGIWFYDKDECARIGQLMNSLVQVATGIDPGQVKDTLGGGRQRRASESDTLAERLNDVKPLQQARVAPTSGAGPNAGAGPGPGRAGPGIGSALQQKNVDILQILSRAQHEYDKSKGGAVGKKPEPKPMIDNPNASATKSTSLPKPVPVKVSQNADSCSKDSNDAVETETPTTQISLETLFRRVSLHQDVAGDALHNPRLQQPVPPQATGGTTSQMPPLLQRLMSNPATTVEEIEREQRGEVAREGRAKPPGGRKLNKASPGKAKTTTQLEKVNDVDTSKKPSNRIKAMASQPKDMSSVVLPLATQVQRSLTDNCRGDLFINGDGTKLPSDQLVPYSLPVLQLPRNTETCGQLLTQRANTASESVVTMATPLANRILPPSLAKTGNTSGLITPQALCQSAGQLAGTAGVSTSHAVSSQLSNAASVLLSPMVFQSASAQRVTPPLAPSHPSSLTQHTVMADRKGEVMANNIDSHMTPLTRQQLQQAMVHLLKTDAGFLSTLHDAYVQSLNQGLSARSDKKH